MGRVRILLAGLMSLVAVPAAADAHRMTDRAIWMADQCLTIGDAAFEHSLRDDLSEQDRTALSLVTQTATFECLGLAMEMCEREADGTSCLTDLAQWVRGARADIAEQLPQDVPAQTDAYNAALAAAQGPADETNCNDMDEFQRTRYCDVVAEGIALEDAYQAWRLARGAGALDAVGHEPIDLEMIR